MNPLVVRVLRILLVACVGVVIAGATLTTVVAVERPVGPVDVRLSLRPSLHGGTRVDIPPLGQLSLRTHTGPLQLRARVTGIRVDEARELTRNPSATNITETSTQAVKSAVTRLLLKALLLGVGAAALGCLIIFRRFSAALWGAVATALVMAGSGGLAVTTANPQALTEPTYTGLLTQAPALIGSAKDIDARFGSYRRQLTAVVTNVTELYNTLSTLPQDVQGNDIQVLWVSDIHDNPEAFDVMRSLVQQFKIDVVIDTGDLSDHGLAAENRLYSPISSLGVPYIYVRGNHDSRAATQAQVGSFRNVRVLDDGITTIAGLTIAGIGDPLFTPDRTEIGNADSDTTALRAAGDRLAATVKASSTPVDIALAHDPTMVTPLFGSVPLILDGHTHRRDHDYRNGTLELTQGSTGGAGLRNLEGTDPLSLEMSILHFSASDHHLLAVDDVTVGGLGERSVRVQRHAASSYVSEDAEPGPSPSASGS